MTEKLFYSEPYCKTFEAAVQSCTPSERGFTVVLDRTAFYPEGGGQPCDLGTLGGAAVTDVREKDGQIVHTCNLPLEVGSTVCGEIDWHRRFDLMQQHSGEHLVSGIVHAKYGYSNVGFHMGADRITIDFDGMIDEDGLREVEQRANEAIWADLETEIFYPSREELAELPYRSKKALEGQVRLVRFPGIDLCACCGTHVARTGEIGLIQLLSCVKFREGVRIELLCGERCLHHLREVREQNRQVSVQLSAKPLETGEAVRRICEELNETRQRVTELENAAFRQKAEALRGTGDVLLFEAPMVPNRVRELCELVAASCGGRCAVFAGTDEQGWKYAVCDEKNDLRPLCKALNAALNGRGGGKPNAVQGSASCTREAIEAFFP